MIEDKLEKMIEEKKDQCIVTRNKKGEIESITNAQFGIMWTKNIAGNWHAYELIEGAKKEAEKDLGDILSET